MEDVIHCHKLHVTNSYDDKTFQITEKDKEIANGIIRLKGTEYNERNLQIDESSASMIKGKDICNKKNYNTLEEI